MGKQKKIIKTVLRAFELIQENCHASLRNETELFIRDVYQHSLNKKDFTRRLLFDTLLSEDDILKILRIIFDNSNKQKYRNN